MRVRQILRRSEGQLFYRFRFSLRQYDSRILISINALDLYFTVSGGKLSGRGQLRQSVSKGCIEECCPFVLSRCPLHRAGLMYAVNPVTHGSVSYPRTRLPARANASGDWPQRRRRHSHENSTWRTCSPPYLRTHPMGSRVVRWPGSQFLGSHLAWSGTRAAVACIMVVGSIGIICSPAGFASRRASHAPTTSCIG
jgi:hypothetical protein